jgi:branched-chain amino acid transport system permease protein
MDILLQQILNGLVLGSLYALVALGYTMVYGILELINFAHGEVVMLGAMVALTVLGLLAGSGLPGPVQLLVALLVAAPFCMAVGFAVERVAYRPLRRAPRLAPLITAIGMSIVLQNAAMIAWGRQYRPFPPILDVKIYEWWGATITDLQIVIVAAAATVMVGVLLIVGRTRLGRAMRATAQHPEVAALMGVDVNRVIALTFVIGSALAAVAGVLVSAYYGLAHYGMGFTLGLKAFTAAVLGGIGSLPGAVLGGLLIGLIEVFWSAYFTIEYKDVAAFSILVLVLIFRPTGLLGRPEVEKV